MPPAKAATKQSSNAGAVHVTDFLLAKNTAKHTVPVIVIAGKEEFLKHEAMVKLRHSVLEGEDADLSFSRLEGDTTTLQQLRTELAMFAMFGSRRLVFLDDADKFVTANRNALEAMVDAMIKATAASETGDEIGNSNVLMLSVDTFPATTKLAKKVSEIGLVVDCSVPAERAFPGWLGRWAVQRHGVTCPRDAAEVLISLVGAEVGLIDQELAKLALLVDSKTKTVTTDMVRRSVGSWRAQKVFDIIDLALNGKTAEAIYELDLLLLAGEDPLGILAPFSSTLRKFATASMLFIEAERAGRPTTIDAALKHAGIPHYYLDKPVHQLKRIGRERGRQLASMLLQADLDLKGASRLPPRIILERLFVQLR